MCLINAEGLKWKFNISNNNFKIKAFCYVENLNSTTFEKEFIFASTPRVKKVPC